MSAHSGKGFTFRLRFHPASGSPPYHLWKIVPGHEHPSHSSLIHSLLHPELLGGRPSKVHLSLMLHALTPLGGEADRQQVKNTSFQVVKKVSMNEDDLREGGGRRWERTPGGSTAGHRYVYGSSFLYQLTKPACFLARKRSQGWW